MNIRNISSGICRFHLYFSFAYYFLSPISLRIGRLGLLPSLIKMMLADSQGGSIAWALVYQLSLDDRGRILISRSECFSFILEYLLRCKETPLPPVPIALAVNLAHVPKLATELSQSKYFPIFLDFAVNNRDAVLAKLLRNATGHSMSSQSSSPAVMEKIADSIFRSSDDYFQVSLLEFSCGILFHYYYDSLSIKSEALGLLANLGEFSLPTSWETLIKDRHLLKWIGQQLKPGSNHSTIL